MYDMKSSVLLLWQEVFTFDFWFEPLLQQHQKPGRQTVGFYRHSYRFSVHHNTGKTELDVVNRANNDSAVCTVKFPRSVRIIEEFMRKQFNMRSSVG